MGAWMIVQPSKWRRHSNIGLNIQIWYLKAMRRWFNPVALACPADVSRKRSCTVSFSTFSRYIPVHVSMIGCHRTRNDEIIWECEYHVQCHEVTAKRHFGTRSSCRRIVLKHFLANSCCLNSLLFERLNQFCDVCKSFIIFSTLYSVVSWYAGHARRLKKLLPTWNATVTERGKFYHQTN